MVVELVVCQPVAAQWLQYISNTVNSVTKVVVPNSSVCPGWGPTCTHAIPCPTTAAPAAPAA